jgi:hypothetical protein
MIKGCSHSDNSIMCFQCYLNGAINPNRSVQEKESQKVIAQKWQQMEIDRAKQRVKLEEWKQLIPELATLDLRT